MFFLDYYDVVYDTCKIDEGLQRRLGYKKILICGKDARIVDGNNYKRSQLEDSVFINTRESNLIGILNMSPKAVIFADSRINKKAIEQMKERKIALCIALSAITASYGLQRSRNLYMISRLFDYASKKKLDVAFTSIAATANNLCSYMQMIELAKLIGADEKYARESISKVNGSLAVK